MKLTITHRLSLSLGTPSRAVLHLLLTPSATTQQRVERWSIETAGIADAAAFRDGFGNRAHLVSQTKLERPVEIVASGVVETTDKAGVLGRSEYDPPAAMFLRPLEDVDAEAVVFDIDKRGGRIAMLHELMERVADWGGLVQSQDQDGQSQSQSSSLPAPQARAELFVGAARALGVPSRFVSGYVFDEEQARFHAWAEAWDEGLGWIGFDPALNLCPSDFHVRLASGLDAASAAPVRSVPIGGIEATVEIAVSEG